MAEHRAVLDASALVALTMRERGADVVRKVVASGGAVTTPTGLAEALNTCRRHGYGGTRDELTADLLELGLSIESLVQADATEMAYLLERSEELGKSAGKHVGKVGSLSLGDVACLAVAHRLNVPAVVSDGTWELIDVPGLRVLPFR